MSGAHGTHYGAIHLAPVVHPTVGWPRLDIPDPDDASDDARVSSMTIREEVDAINAGFGRAFTEQDWAALAGYYTDDARLLFHATPIIRGRAAIEATMREWVSGGPQDLRFETGEVIADGALVVDIETIVGPMSRSKYVVVYRAPGRRQPQDRRRCGDE